MRLSDFRQLWRLARRRQQSEADYRSFQAFQASLLMDHLARFDVKLGGNTVLDLGSGIGGYSEEMIRRGSRVVSLDLMHPSLPFSGEQHVVANALAIPLASNSVPLVFCASLIEHVSEPQQLLQEIERVLAPGCYCYLSYPPFYTPLGGHEFAPFHYFGERVALRLTSPRRKHAAWAQDLYRMSMEPTSFAETYPGWGLYKLTIGKTRAMLRQTRLEVVDLSTRYFRRSAVRWPILGEFLTWHVQFLLRKANDER